MPKMKPDRDDSRGSLGDGGPQRGPIGDGHQQEEGDILSTGGMGGGEQGQGSQRTPGGSSRDSDKQA